MKWILLGIIVFATVLGDLLQSYEMKRAGSQDVNLRGFARLIQTIATRGKLIAAIVCMAVSFFAFMMLLQTEPLSFAVPASAATLILETILAKFLLREHVGLKRTAGAFLVLGGVVLLAK